MKVPHTHLVRIVYGLISWTWYNTCRFGKNDIMHTHLVRIKSFILPRMEISSLNLLELDNNYSPWHNTYRFVKNYITKWSFFTSLYYTTLLLNKSFTYGKSLPQARTFFKVCDTKGVSEKTSHFDFCFSRLFRALFLKFPGKVFISLENLGRPGRFAYNYFSQL